MRAPSLEQERDNKHPEEATMAAGAVEQRELAHRNAPHGEGDEHADEELRRADRHTEGRVTHRRQDEHRESDGVKYAPHT